MSKKLLIRVFLVGIIASIVIGPFTSHVEAASWTVNSQGDCSGDRPKGSSWLNWEGYPSSSIGKTWGSLWFYNGSAWQRRTSGYTQYGPRSEGLAIVNLNINYQVGYWQETGAHQSNFFSGTVNTYGNVFTCPV